MKQMVMTNETKKYSKPVVATHVEPAMAEVF